MTEARDEMIDFRHRVLDVVGALLGLVVFGPLLLLAALIIKLDSSGPVLYRATRVGQNGKAIEVLKFRSMVANADRSGPGNRPSRGQRAAGRYRHQM